MDGEKIQEMESLNLKKMELEGVPPSHEEADMKEREKASKVKSQSFSRISPRKRIGSPKLRRNETSDFEVCVFVCAHEYVHVCMCACVCDLVRVHACVCVFYLSIISP